MKKLKAFLYIFYNSLTSVAYYKDILNTSFSFSIKYLAMLAVIATVITTTVVSTKGVPEINKWAQTQKEGLINLYPQDLEIKVENSVWTINKEQPYIIKTPDYFIEPNTQFPKNFIIFDKNGTINDFEKMDTMMLINEKNILVKTEAKFEVYPLKDLPAGTLNKESFTQYVNQFDKLLALLPYAFIAVTSLFMFFYYFVFRLVYLLFVALTLLIVNIVVKPDVDFKDLYRIGLHAMTVPFLIDMALRVGNIQYSTQIPWFFIVNIVIGTLVMIKAAKINE